MDESWCWAVGRWGDGENTNQEEVFVVLNGRVFVVAHLCGGLGSSESVGCREKAWALKERSWVVIA